MFSKELIIKSSFFNQQDLQQVFLDLQTISEKVSFELKFNDTVVTLFSVEEIEERLSRLDFPVSSIEIVVGEGYSERIEIRLDSESKGSSSYSNRVKIKSKDESFVKKNEIFLNGMLRKYETGFPYTILYNPKLFGVKCLLATTCVFYILKPFTQAEITVVLFFTISVSWVIVTLLEWIFKQFFPYLAIETEKVRPKSVKIKAFFQTRFLDWLFKGVIGVISYLFGTTF